MEYSNEYLEDEGKILQDDIISFLKEEYLENPSLQSRLELYLYEFRFMCRKDSKFVYDGFEVYLNNNDIDLDKLNQIYKDFNKFKIFISSDSDKQYSYINLIFSIKG